MKGLEGCVALVTGAGRGIGRGIALRLAGEGMRVGVNDVEATPAAETVAEIEASSGAAVALVGDVSREVDACTLVEMCAGRFGGIDTLVNNAGVDFSGDVTATDEAAWARVHGVDLRGSFVMVRAALSELASRRGSVINIASTHAHATNPGRSAYAAAKAGVLGLTRALAVELGPKGIRVNAVIPGYIRTPIWHTWLDRLPDAEGSLAALAARHPVGRYGDPADVAGAVAFLASADAGFIAGATLVVDGGYSVLFQSPVE